MFNGMYTSLNYLQMSLDGIWQRDMVISHNIANIETPNYKRQDVSFEDQLKDIIGDGNAKLKKTRAKHIDRGMLAKTDFKPKVQTIKDTSMREDGNNVDIDTQMANQAKNTLSYYYLTEKANQNLRRIKNVINEGRR